MRLGVDGDHNNGTVACIENIKDFTSIFLFSLEIQVILNNDFALNYDFNIPIYRKRPR